MRGLKPVLISTLILGSMIMTGCAERRYSTYDPYYGNGGYYGWNANEDAYYRQWLAERRYGYIDYNRLDRARQREYWEWKNRNAARFRHDPRFNDPRVNDPRYNRNARPNENFSDRDGDHDRDDRSNRNRQVAHDRDGDRDRHRGDRDRHQVQNHRNDRDRNRDRERDRDRDHDHDRR